MKRKFAVAAATAALITASLSFSVFADPTVVGADAPGDAVESKTKLTIVEDPTGSYFYEGSEALDTAGWILYKDQYYFINASGKIVSSLTGAVKDDQESDKATYFLKDGKLVKNEVVTVDGKTYLVGSDGKVVTASAGDTKVETVLIGNYQYKRLVAADGHVVSGWEKINDVWYYAKPDGTVVENDWVMTSPGRWFFVESAGKMLTSAEVGSGVTKGTWTYSQVSSTRGTLTKDGKTYTINEEGLWLTGWVKTATRAANGTISTSWEYYDASGAGKATGWVKVNNKWFHLNNYVASQNKIETIDTVKYAFDKDCYMITGFGQVNGQTVYAKANGELANGVETIDGVKYVFADGVAHVAGLDASYDTDGAIFGEKGNILTNSWYYDDATTAWYYAGSNGKLVKSATVNYAGSKCYMDADGKMIGAGVYVETATGSLTKATFTAGGTDEDRLKDKNTLAITVVLDVNGVQVKSGWARGNNGQWLYADANGHAYDGWLLYKGSWYFINRGVMLTNSYTPDNLYVGADGVWVK